MRGFLVPTLEREGFRGKGPKEYCHPDVQNAYVAAYTREGIPVVVVDALEQAVLPQHLGSVSATSLFWIGTSTHSAEASSILAANLTTARSNGLQFESSAAAPELRSVQTGEVTCEPAATAPLVRSSHWPL